MGFLAMKIITDSKIPLLWEFSLLNHASPHSMNSGVFIGVEIRFGNGFHRCGMNKIPQIQIEDKVW